MDLFAEWAVRLLAAMRGAGEPAEFAKARLLLLLFLAKRGASPGRVEDLVLAAGPVRRIRLDEWCAVATDRTVRLLGLCSGHPRLADGGVITSPVVVVARRLKLAITWSGSLYELLRPLPFEHWPEGAIDLFAAARPSPGGENGLQ